MAAALIDVSELTTLATVARRYGVPEPSLRRIADRLLPGLVRVNGTRMVGPADVAAIEEELRRRGRLPATA